MKHYTMLLIAVICIGSGGCRAVRPNANSCDEWPTQGSVAVCDASVGCEDDSCDGCGIGQVVRGRPIAFLDRAGSVFGVVNKLALWDHRADNHNVSPQTETAVVSYLQRNGLGNTLVRVNQYDPIDEWRRLVSNKRIAAPWRYTFGTYDWLKYTLIPGRLLGGDWYNPFSDSVHLYSDIPTIGLAKAAYAKDVYGRTYPGTYASFQDAPLIGLYHEKLANDEVMSYVRQTGGPADVAEAERILYPDFSGSLGAQTLGFLPYGSVYGRAAGALVGHAAREVKARAAGFVMPE